MDHEPTLQIIEPTPEVVLIPDPVIWDGFDDDLYDQIRENTRTEQ